MKLNVTSLECPVSGRSEGDVFVRIPEVPVLCNVLYDDPEDAVAVPRGDLELAYFPTSGHVYNVAFDPDLLTYTEAYENSLHYSPRFREYARDLADSLIDTYDIRGKTVADIGCGKGDFLQLLCKRGQNTGIGYDPSYEPDPNSSDRPFTVVKDFYSDAYADQPADLICCQHVLEHVADPLDFARTVRRAVGDRRDTVLYFEVPNALFTLRDLGTWDLIYEHCSYFTPSSLSYLFRRAGFDILRIGEAFMGQYLQIELRPGSVTDPTSQDGDGRSGELARLVERFAADYENKRTRWTDQFAQIRRRDQTVVVWGAGSKGTAFLNAVPDADRTVDYVVDVNPKKQGKYIAGTGQRIISPDALSSDRPDVVVLMNGVYESEVRDTLAALGLSCPVEVAS